MMIGQTVHVRTGGPLGWIGRVRAQTGTTLTVETSNGEWRLVDFTRVEVRDWGTAPAPVLQAQ